MPGLSSERLGEAIAALGLEFKLDAATCWCAQSDGGALSAAGIHHGAAAAPRRYLAREQRTITLFDGLPVDPQGRHAAHDAAAIADGWSGWARDLEGQFCAARIDLRRERAELLLDSFGLVPVFLARRHGGVLASNSVHAIRSLLDLDTPDPLGVSTMVGLGWAWRDHTLLSDVGTLAGGAVHELHEGGVTTRVHFGPQSIERRGASATGGDEAGNDLADKLADELAEYMATLTQSAVAAIEPVRCALTAGRDSRLLLALLRDREVVADYYTIGRPGEVDVAYAQGLAASFGLPHRLLVPREDDPQLDWTQMAAHFMVQNDGMSSLGQLADYLEFTSLPAQLGVKLVGIGGEIGRAGPGDMAITLANVPLLGHLSGLQRRALSMKADAYRGLMTVLAQELLDRAVSRFCEDRQAEGWHANELGDLFYPFERMAGWGAAAPRRAAPADDLFTPYCSRRYTEYCLALSPTQRYVELPYHRLMGRLSPELLNHPFASPLLPPRPHRAGWRATRRLAQVVGGRVLPRLHRGAGEEDLDSWPFVYEWFERHIDLMRELFAHDGSPLWQFVARERVNELVHGTAAGRRSQIEGLLRVATVFWYFHGPAPL